MCGVQIGSDKESLVWKKDFYLNITVHPSAPKIFVKKPNYFIIKRIRLFVSVKFSIFHQK